MFARIAANTLPLAVRTIIRILIEINNFKLFQICLVFAMFYDIRENP